MAGPKPLMPVREALELMLSAARPLTASEIVPTLNANGRVLAAAQVSSLNVPSWPKLTSRSRK